MLLTTRTFVSGLMMAAALAVLPVASPFAGAPQYDTSNPDSGLDLGKEIAAQNLITSLNVAEMNGFNIQSINSASLGSMIGGAITNALKIDGVLGQIVNGVITAGVNEGLSKITGGGSMGNFGDTLSKTLTSVLLNGGIQGGTTSGNDTSLGAFSKLLNPVLNTADLTGGTNLASLTGTNIGNGDQLLGKVTNDAGDQLMGKVAAASFGGGIQGAVANNASLTQ